MYDVLSRHPEVGFPPLKELHFWNDLYSGGKFRARRQRLEHVPARMERLLAVETEADYRAYLAECAGDRPVSGDISPDYAMLPAEGFRRMEAAVPDARFLFIMRDPVERHWSWVRMRAARFGRDPLVVLRNRTQALLEHGYAGTRVDYGATLAALRAAELANVRVLLFEDVMADRRRHVVDLLDYLRITPTITPEMQEAMGTASRKGKEVELPPEAGAQLREALDGVYRDVAAHGVDARHCWRY